MKKILVVTSCADCPFFNNEYCNLGIGFVLNEYREEVLPEKCPLRNISVEVRV